MAEGRRGRWIWIVPVVLLVVAVGLALGLRAWFTPERLRGEIAKVGQSALGTPVEVGSAHLSLFPPAVVLADVRVAGVAADDPPLLLLKSGRARLSWAPLLRGRLVVRQLRFESPALALRRDAAGVVLPGPLAPAPEGRAPAAGSAPSIGPQTTVIERLEIVDGSVHLEGTDPSESLDVRGIDLAARVEWTETGKRLRTEGELHLAQLAVAALEPYRASLDRLTPTIDFALDYRLAEGILDLSRVRLLAGPLDLSGTGTLSGLPDAPRIVFDVQPATVALEELLPLVPPALVPEGRTPRAKGPARLGAHVEGPLGDPARPLAVRLDLGFDGAELGMEGFPLGLTDVRGDVAVADSAITLRALTASLGTGTLGVSGRIAGPTAPDSGAMDLDVRAALDLALLGTAGFLPSGTEVAGHLDADTHVASTGANPAEARLSGTVELTGGRVVTPDLPVPLRDLSGKAELAGTSARLRDLSGTLGRSAFRGEGRVDDLLGEPRVTLTGQCPLLDLVELAPPVPPAAAAGVSDTSSAKAPAPAPLPDLIPPLAPMRAHLELAVDSLLAQDTILTGTVLRADVAGAKANVQATIARAVFSQGGVTLANVTGDGTIEGGRFVGSFRAPGGEAYKLPLGAVAGGLEVAGRTVNVHDVTAAMFTGRIEGGAVVDMADPAAPSFTIDSKAAGLSANDLLSALTPAKNVLHGTLDLSSHFTGKGIDPATIAESLVADGTFDAKGGRLDQGPHTQAIWNALKLNDQKAIQFKELAAPFSIRGGKLETRNLVIASPEATWRASGALGFDGKMNYDVEVELGDALAAEFRRRAGGDLAKLLQGDTGRITLNLKITGPTTAPDVALDTSKLAARLQQNAMNQLKSGLNEAKGRLIDQLGLGAPAGSTATTDSSAAAAPTKIEDTLRGLLKKGK